MGSTKIRGCQYPKQKLIRVHSLHFGEQPTMLFVSRIAKIAFGLLYTSLWSIKSKPMSGGPSGLLRLVGAIGSECG